MRGSVAAPATITLAAVLLAAAFSTTQGAEAGWRARLASVPIDPATAPAVTGIGEVRAALDGAALVVTGNFSGLQGRATAARLHAGARTGVRGVPFADLVVTKAAAGTISGTIELTPGQLDALRAGRVYVQLDSEAAPDGNLWGWLLE